ncbi:FecR family protein [bacterium A37T11]|nr:FecR family protein [bacterium A37T11]
MNQHEIRNLLIRYANGQCSPAEVELLEDMVLNHPVHPDWEWDSKEEKIMMGMRIKQQIDRQRSPRKTFKVLFWKVWPVAASFLLIAGISWLWYRAIPDKHNIRSQVQNPSNAATSATTNGITLTLSTGVSLSLDDRKAGETIHDAGIDIGRSTDGGLVYGTPNKSGIQAKSSSVVPVINSIAVGKGRTFQLTLPDGTSVWLNTASTLSYPVEFTTSERRVILKGEAYFNVANDAKKPFYIEAEGNQIAVTGTRFNISAYRDDGHVTTTLLEGGVNVSKGSNKVVLRPGLMAVSFNDTDQIVRSKADLGSIMAWQKGYFIFNDQDIHAIMAQVARWYDIDVKFSATLTKKRFGGTFPKTASVDDLLDDLGALGNIHFRKVGKEVWVIN